MLVQAQLREQNQVPSRTFINYWRTIKPVSVTSLGLRMAGTHLDASGKSLWTHPNLIHFKR